VQDYLKQSVASRREGKPRGIYVACSAHLRAKATVDTLMKNLRATAIPETLLSA
jgi:tagatose-1,6-bisphosphate aldolase non-catalytic subunit AgaZ/GatZ